MTTTGSAPEQLTTEQPQMAPVQPQTPSKHSEETPTRDAQARQLVADKIRAQVRINRLSGKKVGRHRKEHKPT